MKPLAHPEFPLSSPSASPESSLPDQVPPDAGPRSLFGRYVLLLLSDVACRGLRFAADIVLVRHFSPEVIGQLNVSQSLAVQGIALGSSGLDTAGTRAIAAGTIAPFTMAVTVVALRLFLGMIAWSAVAGLALIVPGYHGVFQLTVLYGLSIGTGAMTLGWVAQARQQMHVVALAALATHLGYFGGVELTALAWWPPTAVPLLLAASEGLTAVALWLWLIRTCGPKSRGLPWSEALQFLRDALPLGGANYLRTLTIGSDVLLLGLFVADADVGLYGTGFKLYSLGLAVITLYLSVLLPQLSAHWVRERRGFVTATSTALKYSLLAAALLTPVALLLAGRMLQLLFGPPFSAATQAVQILFLALPVHLIAGHFRTSLVAMGRQRQDLGIVVIATLAHVTFKLCLIPWLGMNGAAWGTLSGEAALMILAWRTMRASIRGSAR